MDGGKNKIVKRGDIWLVRHDPVEGSEQGGIRPFLVVQNDVLNTHSSITIGFSLTSKVKRMYSTYVLLSSAESGLDRESIVMTNQVRTASKGRLLKKLGTVDSGVMRRVEEAFLITFGVGM